MTYPRKRFGQNFLQDQFVLERIIEVVQPQANDHFVEIGPGLGALTQLLLPRINALDAVEIDRDLIPELQTVCHNLGNLVIHEADALRFNYEQLQIGAKTLRFIGNLPYNIATELLFRLFAQLSSVNDMHFMLQKEVAERIVAVPGNKKYGRLSIMAQYFCRAEILFYVSPDAFFPMPKVYSAFIRLVPHAEIKLQASDYGIFQHVVKLAFSHRRKTIHNSLKELVTDEQLQQLNIDRNLRAEQLSLDDFINISNLLVE